MIYLVIFINLIRFVGLDISPPGFYADEAAGATQALCIAENGKDFYGNFLPTFPAGFIGAGVYTPAYIYGQVIWTSIFGNSIFVFRSFLAFATTLTILFLYLFVRNRTDKRTAILVAFSASIMPWAFHFSRIAWDPPIAVLFFIAALWASDLKKGALLAGFFLGICAISYPPMRLAAPLFFLILPGLDSKKKLIILMTGAFVCIPVFLSYLDANFSARTGALSIFSPLINNKFRNLEGFSLLNAFLGQYFSHFSIDYLFLSGDGNTRSSIGTFGMLSWLDGLAIISAPYLIIQLFFRNSKFNFLDSKNGLLIVAILGIGCSVFPSSLTNEGVPHALRSIGAWPFFAVLTGVSLSCFQDLINRKIAGMLIPLIGCTFFSLYFYSYMTKYPAIAKPFFLSSSAPIDLAYKKMVVDNEKCDVLRTPAYSPLKSIEIGEMLNFSNKTSHPYHYLLNNWHDPEEFGIWSNGKTATLELPTPSGDAKTLAILYKAFINGNHPKQKLIVTINNQVYETLEITNPGVSMLRIDLAMLPNKNGLLSISLETPGATSPTHADSNSLDSRKLGIALISAHFE